MISSFREEERERLPRITNSLNELVNDVEALKSKSEFVSSEMEMFRESIKSFQNKIKDSLSHITTLNEVFNLYYFTIYRNIDLTLIEYL